jgi:hypothetical protein
VSLGRLRASGVGTCKQVMRGANAAGEAAGEGTNSTSVGPTSVVRKILVEGSSHNREISK